MDISKLTLGEVAKVEELSGQSMRNFGDDTQPMGKMLAALAFVARRRTDPAFSWNDALGLEMDEAMTIAGLNDDEPDEGEVEPDPTEAATPPQKRTKRA